MLIDWFTVVAQMINFLLLLWLLNRFLYRPLISAMDKREKLLAENWETAAQAKAEAEAARQLFTEKGKTIELKKQALLKTAQEEAEQEKQQLLVLARSQVEKQQTEWESSLGKEQKQMQERLQQEIQQEVLALAEQFLLAFADVRLEEEMLAAFLRRWRQEVAEGTFPLANLQGNTPAVVIVRSAFVLSVSSRRQLEEAFREIGLQEPQVSFEYCEKLGCGLEVLVNEQKLSWSLDSYLTSLRQETAKLLAATGREEAQGGGE